MVERRLVVVRRVVGLCLVVLLATGTVPTEVVAVPAQAPVPVSIFGKVTADGVAVPNAPVTLRNDAGAQWAATTNALGNYRFANLADGRYLVEATAPGYASGFGSDTSVPTPEDVVTIAGTGLRRDVRLARLGQVSGRLSTADGVLPAYPRVVIGVLAPPLDVLWGGAASTPYLQSLYLSPDGRFHFDGVAPGSFVLLAEAPSDPRGFAIEFWNDAHTQADATPITVTSGVTSGPYEMVLDVGGSVSGRVPDGRGMPLASAPVSVVDEQGSAWYTAQTDAMGRYTIPRVHPGRWRVSAAAGPFFPSDWYRTDPAATTGTRFDLGIGEIRSGVDIVLGPTTVLEATFLDADGVPLPDPLQTSWVVACQAPQHVDRSTGMCPNDSQPPYSWGGVTPGGAFWALGLPSGRYNVSAFGVERPPSTEMTVSLRSGAIVACTFRLGGQVSCAPKRQTRPDPPTAVQVTGNAGRVEVTWTDASYNEYAFAVDRRIWQPATRTWGPVSTVAYTSANAPYAVDTPGVGRIQYRVRAINHAGQSASAYTTVVLAAP